jgi:4-hydroxyphenylpyruvate dioxygenase
VQHTFVSRTGEYALPQLKAGGLFMPGYRKLQNISLNEFNAKHPCGLKFFDHCVGNGRRGSDESLGRLVRERAGLLDVQALRRQGHLDRLLGADVEVMASGNHLIKMPINEPAPGKKKSQVQEYLDWHDNTPGVQHLALRTDDELASIADLAAAASTFLQIPETYYESVWQRVDTMLKQHGTRGEGGSSAGARPGHPGRRR